ncbi:serine hydrolase domain-containing protein [Nocardia brasiliensis]|uniref:serine hydrolase domain-containing protein n=1 Tax=Nocardia brasiliensis TaxID=37326 RepID=UPI0037A2F0F1
MLINRSVVVSAAVVVALLVIGCGAPAGFDRTAAFPDRLADKIEHIVQSRLDAGLIPGAAVAIIDPRHGKFSRAYGFADVATERRSQIHDRYRVGSITKNFVAVAVLRLVEAGELGLHDRLSKFVAGIPNGDRITIWDLLGMRGGIVDFSSNSVFEPLMMADAAVARWTPEDTLRLIKRHRDKAQPPNYQTVYSNSEYFLLGLVLEKVTGRPVGVVINELIGAYGLHETGYPNDAVMPAPASHGYAYSGDVRTDVTMRTSPAVWGAAASVVSSVTDLASYAQSFGRGRLLRPESFEAQTSFVEGTSFGSTFEYGLGLMRAGSWLGHTGSVLGYTAITMYLPQRRVSVAITVNQNTFPGRQLYVDATLIWADIVDELYPGTLFAPHETQTASNPPLPKSADLTARIRAALDPATPAAGRQLRIADTDADPELFTKVARVYASYKIAVTVDKVTEIGPAQMLATTHTTSPYGNAPMVIPFYAVDGTWQISTEWACQQIFDEVESPACA